MELKRNVDSTCNCQSSINYDIPCCHQLSQYKEQPVDASCVSRRWFLNSDVREGSSKVSPAKPWMNYIIALETAFRTLDDSNESIDELAEYLDNIPQIRCALTTVETNIGAKISLPNSTAIKYPGRPPKLPRLSSLKKDFSRSEYRKRILLYGKRVKANKDEDKEDEPRNDATDSGTSIFNSLPKNKLYLPPKRKLVDGTNENKKSYKTEDLFKPQKKRNTNNEQRYHAYLHPSIDKNIVRNIYNPEGDGNCGYRAISYIRYKNEHRFKEVKAKMLEAFEKNKHIYKNIFVYKLDDLEKNIRACMNNESSQIAQWFISPDCAQVVADAYDVPVCVYPSPSSLSDIEVPLTYLPVRAPTKLKMKCKPYVIQNKDDIHWFAVDFDHVQVQYPTVQTFYFRINPQYSDLFQQTWNYYGQFPKLRP